MLYTRLYSVHPYWWKRQVLHQMWPSGSQHASKKECRQDIHSGFETHEEGHTKSKTGAISGSTKWTLVQTKKKKKKSSHETFHLYSVPHKLSWYFDLFVLSLLTMESQNLYCCHCLPLSIFDPNIYLLVSLANLILSDLLRKSHLNNISNAMTARCNNSISIKTVVLRILSKIERNQSSRI